jgi:hypothetical protein
MIAPLAVYVALVVPAILGTLQVAHSALELVERIRTLRVTADGSPGSRRSRRVQPRA